MKDFLLEIAAPDRLLLRQRVSQAQIPARSGEIGARPGHAALLAELGAGVLSYFSDGRRSQLSVNGGLVEITPDNVRVLAHSAEPADEIDSRRAQEALRRASERLARPGPDIDIARALNAMRRAQARLQAARKLS